MSLFRVRTAVAAALVLALMGGLLSAASARGSRAGGGFRAVRREFSTSPQAERRFWTRQRMRAAQPLVGSYDVGTTAMQEAPFTRREITDPAMYPYRLHGKLFVRQGRVEYHCSATALNSANESVVFTAAHCLYGKEIGGWVDSVSFVPGYRFGNKPYGTWVAQEAFVTPGWLAEETARLDIGAVVMSPLNGSSLTDAIGGRDVAFGQERKQTFEIFGYPATGEFNGERLYRCKAETVYRDESPDGSGPDPMGLGCDMTQGSSGGGWVVNGTTLNSVSSYGYQDKNGNDLPYMFGPYFGTVAEQLFATADAVQVQLPQISPPVAPTASPSPTASSSEPPAPSPSPTTNPVPISAIADGNDSRGLFDIAQVAVSNADGAVTVDVRTHDEWRVGLLSKEYRRNIFYVDFDSFGDHQFDYYLVVFSRDGRLEGKVLQYGAVSDQVVGTARMQRSSRRGFIATIPSNVMQSEAKLLWFASSFFKTRNRCVTVCRDKAPDRGLAGS